MSAWLDRIPPVVISSLTMKDSKPVRIVATDQAGFQLPAWKSLNEVHSLRSGCSRPEGEISDVTHHRARGDAL